MQRRRSSSVEIKRIAHALSSFRPEWPPLHFPPRSHRAATGKTRGSATIISHGRTTGYLAEYQAITSGQVLAHPRGPEEERRAPRSRLPGRYTRRIYPPRPRSLPRRFPPLPACTCSSHEYPVTRMCAHVHANRGRCISSASYGPRWRCTIILLDKRRAAR